MYIYIYICIYIYVYMYISKVLFFEGSEYGDAAVEESSATAWVWPLLLLYNTPNSRRICL